MKNILKYFPLRIRNILEKEVLQEDFLEEIRIRVKKPIILKFKEKDKIIDYLVSPEEILDILHMVCENSIYSYQHRIAEGYVTIRGGHRVGIAGSCVIENGKIINISYINSLNFRIARQIFGISKDILKYIVNQKENIILNTLIVSRPGVGKTTLLKDIVRQISTGIEEFGFKGVNTGIVDERGEIAALYKGIPQNDIGIKSDVMDNVSKSDGIKMLIRSMAPQVIVADEIGNFNDVDAINYAMSSGCKGIFTIHGQGFEDLFSNKVTKELINECFFEVIIFLDSKEKGKVKELFLLDKKEFKYKIVNIN